MDKEVNFKDMLEGLISSPYAINHRYLGIVSKDTENLPEELVELFKAISKEHVLYLDTNRLGQLVIRNSNITVTKNFTGEYYVNTPTANICISGLTKIISSQ